MKIAYWRRIVFILLLSVCQGKAGGVDAYFDTLLQQIAQIINQKKPAPKSQISLVVKEVPCNNFGREGIGPYSPLLQMYIQNAIFRSSRFKEVTRKELEALVEEGKLQQSDLVSGREDLLSPSLGKADAILFGRYIYFNNGDESIIVHLEVVFLHGGNVVTSSISIPLEKLPHSYPGKDTQNTSLKPVNSERPSNRFIPTIKEIKDSKKNEAKVKDIAAAFRNRNIGVSVSVDGASQSFYQGEEIRFKVRVDRDCHIAVIDHFVDGQQVILFPKEGSKDTLIKKNSITFIPGDEKSGFFIRVREPFGSDIVQVIACESKTELDRILRQKKKIKGLPYYSLSKGALTKGLEAVPTSASSLSWGESHLIIHTVRKPF